MRIVALLTVLALAACGAPGSSGTLPPPTDVTGPGCAPVPGDDLVVLTDDRKLAYSDNLLPALNAKAATPAVLAVLNAVSASLDTQKLRELNAQVDLERESPSQAAQGFAQDLAVPRLTEPVNLRIGAANFSESQIMANLYAEGIRRAGGTVSVTTVGNRELYLPALARGEIDAVPEYAGTLTEFLNVKLNGANASPAASGDIGATMAALVPLAQREGLAVGQPSPAADQNAFAVTREFAETYNISTLSEFGQRCAGLASVLGGPPECPRRPQCQPGLQEVYGARFGRFVALDAGGPQTKTALRTGRVTLGLVLSSDASLS